MDKVQKIKAEIEKLRGNVHNEEEWNSLCHLLSFIDSLPEESNDIDEEYKAGKYFTGLVPCWVNAPSTLEPAHEFHGKNIVAVHMKNGGYRCCCVDERKPSTFNLPEGTSLAEGWKDNRVIND